MLERKPTSLPPAPTTGTPCRCVPAISSAARWMEAALGMEVTTGVMTSSTSARARCICMPGGALSTDDSSGLPSPLLTWQELRRLPGAALRLARDQHRDRGDLRQPVGDAAHQRAGHGVP